MTAVVQEDWKSLSISTGGLATSEIPGGWRGKNVQGELFLTGTGVSDSATPASDGIEGTFTSSDGDQVQVWGGGEGIFFKAACQWW